MQRSKTPEPAACLGCGVCLQRCPVLDLDALAARQAVRDLDAGLASPVLHDCIACRACSLVCPQGRDPSERIIGRWQQLILERGLPARAGLFMVSRFPNFRSRLLPALPADERRLVATWSRPPSEGAREILYPGCNWLTSPYLAASSLLDGLPIHGALELCCGATLSRSGLKGDASRQARRVHMHLASLEITRLWVPCAACLHALCTELPDKLPFPVEHLSTRLLDQIDAGRIRTRNLGMEVALQISCNDHLLGPAHMERVRELLARLGLRVREIQEPCCGIGAGFSPLSGYHPIDILRTSLRTLRQARQTGADALVVLCAGCLQTLSVASLLMPSSPELYHLFELVQLAAGERPLRRHIGRARLWWCCIAPHLLRPGRIFPEGGP
ncbi:MAG: (Fe-S)-binding protein [Deltaproteobacteria bacterium]|nr:(Fe-S)-binding protein [Deltaproteobacteria bacterium]